jgi:hypothetical protein
MTIYRDPNVQFGGMQVGGFRISHMTHMESDTTLAMTITKAKRAPYTVKRLVMQEKAAPAPAGMTPAGAVALAETAAGKGSAHFRAWYNTDEGKDCRATGALTPEAMARLKGICDAADAKPAAELDPFGLPPIPAAVATDAEAQLRAEIAERDAAHTMAAE